MSSELSSGDDSAEEEACDHYSSRALSTVPDMSPGPVRLPSRGRRSGEDQAGAFSPSSTHALRTCERSGKRGGGSDPARGRTQQT